MSIRPYLMALSLGTLLLVSCNGDEPEIPTTTTHVKNQNANAYVAPGQGITEKTSTITPAEAARRLEMPRLKGGADNLFIVHTVPSLGVNYCMEYDCSALASRWTAYQWYTGFSTNVKDDTGKSAWNRNQWKYGATYNGYGGDGDPFQPDPLIPREYRTELEDHRSNGYDRGHMLGSADRLNSKEANGQTFYLSNMHPQSGPFNQGGIWYTLEGKLRDQYDKSSFRDTLYVVKGGTIDNGQYSTVKGASGRKLIVPKYFFMALLCKNKSQSQGGYKAIAFWMEHKDNYVTNPTPYAISIDELEKKTGIDFFCNLPDDLEETIEANCAPAAWGLK